MLATTRSMWKSSLGLGLATLFLAACAGGGGSGSGGQTSGNAAQPGTGGAGGTATTPAGPDTQAPTVTPDAASGPNTFHTISAGTITLRGTADDNVGVASVTVNGTLATLGGTPQASTWQADVPATAGINILTIEAADAAGNSVSSWQAVCAAERFLDPQTAVEDSAYVYITDSGFQAFSSLVTSYFTQNNALAVALVNQALNIPLNANLGIAGITAQVTRISFDPPTVTLTPTANGLSATVVVPNVDMTATAPVVGTFQFLADSVDVRTTIRVDVANGQYQVAVSGTQANVQNPRVISNNTLINLVAPAIIRGASGIIAQNVQTLLGPAITRALNSLNPSYQQTVLGVTFTASAQPQSIRYGTDGIEIALETNLTHNAAGNPNAPGSIGFLQTGAPTYGQGQHVSVAISSAAVNRALYAAWDSGLMSYTIDQQFLTQFGIHLPIQISTILPLIGMLFPSLQALGTAQNIGLQFAFDLPPSADLSSQSPNLRLAAGGMRVSLVLDFGTGYVPVLSLDMAGELGGNVQTNAQSIQLSLQAPTQFRFDITRNGNPMNLPLQSVNSFVNMAIGQGIQLLGQFIPAIPIPALPAFQGVQLGLQSLDTTFEPRFVILDATIH